MKEISESGHFRPEVGRSEPELDEAVAETEELAWRASQLMVNLKSEMGRSELDLERLKALQTQLEETRDRQIAALGRQRMIEAALFTKLGL